MRVNLGLSLCLVAYIASFYIFHTSNGILRYSSFVDLHRVAYSTACSGVVVCIMHQLQVYLGLTPYILIPRFNSGVALFLIATMLMWCMRVVVKALYDRYSRSQNSTPVVIYGNMQGGIALAKSISVWNNANYRLAGFISTTPLENETWLMGVRVYDDTDDIVEHLLTNGVRNILVSPLQRSHFFTRTSLIDNLLQSGINIFLSNPAQRWDGKSHIEKSNLQPLQIEDLLSRQIIDVDMQGIEEQLRGRRIMITGAAGSIGSEMVRQVALYQPCKMILIDQAETPMHDIRLQMEREHPNIVCHTIVASITDATHMESIFQEYRPEYLFHAAAYKHVPMLEDNPVQAVHNNVRGTRIVADLAVKYGTKKFVMISTDKAVNPTNVMGCSKRICEIYCQSLNSAIWNSEYSVNKAQPILQADGSPAVTQFVTTRFGNVLGSNGSVIPLFRSQIEHGGPVTVTHPDIIRYFMLISEACKLVLEAGTMGRGGEIFVFDMGEPVRIADLARRMIQLSGAKDVEIEFTGLRDGEKLYEEMLADKEQTLPTSHPKILRATVRNSSYQEALTDEEQLFAIASTRDDMAIVRKMKQIVPEYKSHQSRYEVLDSES